MFSLTPATRVASIWSTCTPPDWRSCFAITRLAMCSPVATGTGATSRAMRACPRMSSGLVGSSIQARSNSASLEIHPIAWSTSQRWLASTAIRMSGPTASRASLRRRTSSSRSLPTLSLICSKPSSTASRASRTSFSSS
jgi:hypothetical protein